MRLIIVTTDREKLNKGPPLTIHTLVFYTEKVIYANDRHLHSFPVLLSNFHIPNHLLSFWVCDLQTWAECLCFSDLKAEKINSTESDFTFSPFTLSILYSFASPCRGFSGLSTKCKHEMKVFLQFQSKAICLKGEKVVSCWLSTNNDSQHSHEGGGGSLQEWKARTVVL